MASADKVPMLEEGHRKLNEDLKRLKMERPEIVEAIEAARAHGDLSENAEYHAAKERQGQIEATIADVEDQLSRAMVIDPKSLSGDKVVFGATVTLRDEDDKKVRYQLVGQVEADANQGRISFNSPLGRALIGRQVGEEVEVSTPSGDRYYEIKKIEFICASWWIASPAARPTSSPRSPRWRGWPRCCSANRSRRPSRWGSSRRG